MAAATSAWLAGNFFKEPVDFIFLCLSKADDLKVVFALRVGHAHHLAPEPPHRAKAKLSVSKAFDRRKPALANCSYEKRLQQRAASQGGAGDK